MIQRIDSLCIPYSFHFWIAGVLCCFLISCSSSSKDQITQNEKPFFDLSSYFESEIDRLNASSIHLKKEVTFNDSIETQVMEQNDFSQELKLFAETDINRKALIDKYQSDSVIVNNQIDRLIYMALDSSLNIRKIIINYTQREVTQIDVYKKQKSIVGFSQQHLHYAPQKGYMISSLQKTMFANPKRLKIEAFFH